MRIVSTPLAESTATTARTRLEVVPGRTWVERRIERHAQAVVLCFALAICLTSVLTPPRLMDDLDAGQADIARNMLTSGNWVTPQLDGIKFLDKSPPLYWMIAVSFRVFGVHDWAARIPLQLFAFLM